VEQKDKESMVSYLADTNVLVYAFKGIEPYAGWVRKAIEQKTLFFSSIVVAEFLEGAQADEEISLKMLLDNLETLSVDRVIAEEAAKYRKLFNRKSKKIWMSDCMIAATCKVNSLTLVTADKKDYPMDDITIKRLK